MLVKNIPAHDENFSKLTLSEFKARLLWLTSVLAYFFIMSGFGVFIWHTLKNAFSKSTFWVFIVIASTITAVETIYLVSVDSQHSPIASIFKFTFDTLYTSGLYTSTQLAIISATVDIINFLSFLVVPFGIIAGCCIMHKVPINLHKGTAYFLERSRQLKKLTAGASAVLVIGIIHMQLWLNWPLALQEQTENIANLRSILLSICQYWGISYTLIITALYLPAAAYLGAQARLELLEEGDAEQKKEPEKWLLEHNMIFSPMASLPQIIAVIAPMLVGSFGSTLSGLTLF